MRVLGVTALLAVLAGCTTVKLSQRDGCWVRRTERSFGRTLEELGPCVPPQPAWSQDRLTRLVQECAHKADYRWAERARHAWARGAPAPAQPAEQEILRTCMQEARVGLAAEADGLRTSLAAAAGERDDLRRLLAEDHAALRASHDRIAGFLGEAAQKPAGSATATATATGTGDGTASNASLSGGDAVRPVADAPTAPEGPPPLAAPAAELAAPPRRKAAGRARRALVEAAARGCPVPAQAAPPAGALSPAPPPALRGGDGAGTPAAE